MQEIKNTSLFVDEEEIFKKHCDIRGKSGSKLDVNISKAKIVMTKLANDVHIAKGYQTVVSTFDDIGASIDVVNGKPELDKMYYYQRDNIDKDEQLCKAKVDNVAELFEELDMIDVLDTLFTKDDEEENEYISYENQGPYGNVCSIKKWSRPTCKGLEKVNPDIETVVIWNYHLLSALPFNYLRDRFPNYRRLAIQNLVGMTILDFSNESYEKLPKEIIIQSSILEDIVGYKTLGDKSLEIYKSLIPKLEDYDYKDARICKVDKYNIHYRPFDNKTHQDITCYLPLSTCQIAMKTFCLWDNHVFYRLPKSVKFSTKVIDMEGNLLKFSEVGIGEYKVKISYTYSKENITEEQDTTINETEINMLVQ